MKLVSLNLWGGRMEGELLRFLRREREAVDVFCFQEVLKADFPVASDMLAVKQVHAGGLEEAPDLYARLKSALPGFDDFLETPKGNTGERQGIFFKHGVKVKENGFVPASEYRTTLKGVPLTLSSGIQYVVVEERGRLFTLGHIHGLWQDSSKEDTPERFRQSESIIRFLERAKGKKVIVGDFNLLPDTRSIRMVEGSGMVNLIRLNGVQSTRSSFYLRPGKSPFADYAFVSKDTEVAEFKVLKDEVSDHLPLYIEFR